MDSKDDIDDLQIEMVSKVLEHVPYKSRDEILFILRYYNNDVDTAVNAFTEGMASELLKKFHNSNNTRSNRNKRKKKKSKKANQVPKPEEEEASSNVYNAVAEEDDEEEDSVSELATRIRTTEEPLKKSSLENLNSSSSPKDALISQENVEVSAEIIGSMNTSSICTVPYESPGGGSPDKHLVDIPPSSIAPLQQEESLNSSHKTNSEIITKPMPRNRHRSTGSFSQSRTASISEESSSRPGSQLAGALSSLSAGQGKKILEKSLKDLSRQTVSLQRVNNLLEEELDLSFKRIKSAISEAQKLLELRNHCLETEMERVKSESRQLLNQRKETAADLKQRAERAATMAEPELLELRADIKQFVVDRKYDEELGKTIRFMWNKDRITEEIQKFGEIIHVKNCYSQRRQSVSSVSSSTCQASWSAQEVTSELNSLTDSIDVAAINSSTTAEHHSDSKPSCHVPPSQGRFRVFFNTTSRNANSNDNDRGGKGGRGGGGQHHTPGAEGGPGSNGGQPRSNYRPFPHSSRGRGVYQGEPRGRGGQNREGRGHMGGDGGGGRGGGAHYAKQHYPNPHQQRYGNNNNDGDEMNLRNQRPSIRRGGGGRYPRYQGQHYPRHNRHNNNNNDSYVPVKDAAQVNGESVKLNIEVTTTCNLSNGFVHTEPI